MSRTIRRRGFENTLGSSWNRQARRVVGFYNTWDFAFNTGNGHQGVKLYRPMTERERYDECSWMHAESKHNNARGPNWYYKRVANRRLRVQENMELRKELLSPEYDGVYFNKRPNWLAYDHW